MNSLESYDRAMAYKDSEANAICLCQGNFTLFCDDVPGAIRHFGNKGRLAFGHFRDVQGTAFDFAETFHDQGMTDKVGCMEAWHEIGFSGPLRPDHVPTLAGGVQRRSGVRVARSTARRRLPPGLACRRLAAFRCGCQRVSRD